MLAVSTIMQVPDYKLSGQYSVWLILYDIRMYCIFNMLYMQEQDRSWLIFTRSRSIFVFLAFSPYILYIYIYLCYHPQNP